jgi:hypothetical protein
MEQILLALASFISTGLGGLVAIRYKNRPHLSLGFTAGVFRCGRFCQVA